MSFNTLCMVCSCRGSLTYRDVWRGRLRKCSVARRQKPLVLGASFFLVRSQSTYTEQICSLEL